MIGMPLRKQAITHFGMSGSALRTLIWYAFYTIAIDSKVEVH